MVGGGALDGINVKGAQFSTGKKSSASGGDPAGFFFNTLAPTKAYAKGTRPKRIEKGGATGSSGPFASAKASELIEGNVSKC